MAHFFINRPVFAWVLAIATMLGEELPAPVEEVQPEVKAATEVVETEADEEVKED